VNGPQDLGGQHGFGPVRPEPDEPPFHEPWERRALALTLAMGATGAWNIDASRAARESMPPADYLSSGYYRIWIEGMTRLIRERGLASDAELADGRMREPPRPLPRRLDAAAVPAALAAGSPTQRPALTAARFALGDAVRSRRMNPESHTRLPRYVRGCAGTVVALHGAHVFPDSHARGDGERPCWLYTVRFDAHALWGPDTTASSVCVDCWEPYLEPAGTGTGAA
jgi:nitrile hydratase beta subunit